MSCLKYAVRKVQMLLKRLPSQRHQFLSLPRFSQDSHFMTTECETSLCKKPELSVSTIHWASLFLTVFCLSSPPNTQLQRWRLNWTWFGGDCRSQPHSQQLTEMSGASNSSYSVCLWWKGLPPWVIGYQFKMEIDIHLFPFSLQTPPKWTMPFNPSEEREKQLARAFFIYLILCYSE